MNSKIKFFLIFWLIFSIIFWLLYTIFVEYISLGLYMPLFFCLLGLPIYLKRKFLEEKLKNWNQKPFLKFILLGYLMVLLEEIIAGFVNHLLEDFSLPLLIARILQYQFFNLFAFTGFIFGVYFSLKLFNYSRTEIFFVAGLWGLYTEKVIFQIFVNPSYILLTIIPMIFIYGIIIYPSILSIELTKKEKKYNKFLKYSLTLLLMFVFSILPILIVTTLRTNFPFLFPPEHLLPL